MTTDSTPTIERLAQVCIIAERHRPYDAEMQNIQICDWCEMTWPCDTTIVLAAYDRLAAEQAEHRKVCHDANPDAVIVHLHREYDKSVEQIAALVEALRAMHDTYHTVNGRPRPFDGCPCHPKGKAEQAEHREVCKQADQVAALVEALQDCHSILGLAYLHLRMVHDCQHVKRGPGNLNSIGGLADSVAAILVTWGECILCHQSDHWQEGADEPVAEEGGT